jgi:succinate-semialdehyde dehydrogenase/glutarate-semialdehyde dehydrogenase
MTHQSINPNDGRLLKSFEHLTPAQLETSLALAQRCFSTSGQQPGDPVRAAPISLR